MLKKKREIEEQFGFYPSPTCNYITTIFDVKTKHRGIFLDGAIPLHSFAPILYEIIYSYINNSTKYQKYIISVIIKEKSYLNLFILQNYDTKDKKYDECRKILDKLFEIFDICYSVFIKEDSTKKTKYRKDTSFKKLKDSYEVYLEIKKKNLKLLEIN